MNRIAICLSSQLREIDKTLKNIKDTFSWYFYKSKIDYFVYSPNYFTRKHTLLSDIMGDPYVQYISESEIQYIKDTLNPISMYIEKDDEILDETIKTIINDGDLYNHAKYFKFVYFGQHYYAEKVIELKHKYEKENGFEYDYVIRTRPDIFFRRQDLRFHRDYFYHWYDRFDIEEKNKEEFPSVIGVPYIDVRLGTLQVGDQMFGGRSKIMDQYHQNMTKMNCNIFMNKKFGIYVEETESYYWEMLKKAPPEQRWAYYGLVNKISFQPTFILDWIIPREYFYKKYNEMTVQHLDEYFIWSDRMNYKLCNFINEHRLNYKTTIDILKNKNIFKYKNADELILELNRDILSVNQEEELKKFLEEKNLC